MKKKGLLAMGLAGVLTVGMCMPVFAAAGNSIDSDNGTKAVEVTFSEDEKFSVTIPTALTVGEVASEIELTATGNLIEGNSLNVTINEMSNDGIAVDYYKNSDHTGKVDGKGKNITITKGDAPTSVTSNTDPVATFTNGTDGNLVNAVKNLQLGAKPINAQAGYYKGTATFTVAVATAP